MLKYACSQRHNMNIIANKSTKSTKSRFTRATRVMKNATKSFVNC